MPKPSSWKSPSGPSWITNVPPRHVMTLLWSPSQPMAEAVPSAPVKSSVSTLNAQRYAASGPAAGTEAAAAAGPVPGKRGALRRKTAAAAAKKRRGRRRSSTDSASRRTATSLPDGPVVAPASGPEDDLDGVAVRDDHRMAPAGRESMAASPRVWRSGCSEEDVIATLHRRPSERVAAGTG